MTARPIRYQRQVSDRKGKIFYTSITSLSHISKVTGNQALNVFLAQEDAYTDSHDKVVHDAPQAKDLATDEFLK